MAEKRAVARCRGGLLMLAGLLLLPAAQAAREQTRVPAAEDYAYSWPVFVQAPADLYEVEIPIGLYRSALDPALRDLGVYSASGEPVPRFIRPPEPVNPLAGQSATLAALPVWASPGKAASDVRLSVQRRDGGTELRLESADQSPSGARSLVAYVADVSQLRHPLRALELAWPAEAEPLMLALSVEGSTDLDQWYPLGSGTVVGLKQDGASIERHRIELSGRAAHYLRISWQDAPPAWRLDRIAVHYWEAAPGARLEQLRLRSHGRDPKDRGYLYDLGGAPLVQQFALGLPPDNVVIRASVLAWNPESSHWEPVHAGVFYHLRRDGADVRNEPVGFGPRRARYWKVIVERGRPELDLVLTLGWRPDRLVFVAQGRAPWLVAAGSAQDRERGFPQARQFSEPEIAGLLQQAGRVGVGKLGARRVLGGTARLQPTPVRPWGRWLLWLGLTGGVAIVALMAVRLLRQLQPPA